MGIRHTCLGRARADCIGTGIRVAELDATVPPDEVPEHEHDDAHVVLVLNGVYSSAARFMPDEGLPLSVVSNPPGTAHRDRFLDLPGRYLVIEIARELWRSAPGPSAGRRGAVRMAPDALNVLLPLRVSLFRDEVDLDRRREELVLELCARACAVPRADRRPPPWLNRVRELFHDRCTAPPSLDEAARDAGVHPTSLSRAFRRHFGMTISQWNRSCRVEHAARLLRRGGHSLAEAALESGFCDQAHLTREIRRSTGLTPLELRRLFAASDG